MSWVSAGWDWYAKPEHYQALKPLVALVGSLIVGGGTITVGYFVARAALRQADIASRRHEEQTRADRARRITDTFSKAVEQLGAERMEVRIGGIYTLERLAGEALSSPQAADGMADQGPDLYWTVMETLTAFVRERAKWQEEREAAPATVLAPAPATDITAVLTVIQRRPESGRAREQERDWSFDLRAADLRGAVLVEAHLERAVLMGVHLDRAILLGARLDRAILADAHLERAVLRGAHLEHAVLSGGHLEGANLMGAHLERADLGGAHLEGAILEETQFEGAILEETHLERAVLDGAHLGRARLSGAYLRGASLIDAHLERTHLDGAHLEDADLSRAHLERASLEGVDLSRTRGDSRTRLPEGVARPAHWPAYDPD
jgi:uncharacterized protein YjbI with pentapeptide repeats